MGKAGSFVQQNKSEYKVLNKCNLTLQSEMNTCIWIIQGIGLGLMSHPILRIKWDAKSYVRPEISHTHKPINYR